MPPNGKRRFRREHVAQFLRERVAPGRGLEAGFLAGDLDACLASLVEPVAWPEQLEEALDRLAPFVAQVTPAFAQALFGRLPFLVHDGDEHALAVVCGPSAAGVAMARCVLRGRGMTVLVPSEAIAPERLPSWVRATEPHVAVFDAGPTPSLNLLQAAIAVSEACPSTYVLVHVEPPGTAPPPLRSVRTMRELGILVDLFGPRRPPARLAASE